MLTQGLRPSRASTALPGRRRSRPSPARHHGHGPNDGVSQCPCKGPAPHGLDPGWRSLGRAGPAVPARQPDDAARRQELNARNTSPTGALTHRQPHDKDGGIAVIDDSTRQGQIEDDPLAFMLSMLRTVPQHHRLSSCAFGAGCGVEAGTTLSTEGLPADRADLMGLVRSRSAECGVPPGSRTFEPGAVRYPAIQRELRITLQKLPG